jgi:Kef-type K+ transport system membrane component KefB
VNSSKLFRRLLGLTVAIVTVPALAEGSGHGDPAAPVILALAVILVAAKFGGDLATRIGQPAVLGELLMGVVLGNVSLLGLSIFEPISTNTFIDMFSRVGVIILLFEVGLESTVSQMLKVGVSALLVACIGVAVPFVLGYFVTRWLLPGSSEYVALFLGATLTATSVGITARVLKDLEKSQTQEARIVLGAAVIDDVLGLVILAVVTGVIAAADLGKELALGEVVLTLSKAVGFLVGSLVLGVWLSPRLFKLASLLRARMVLLAFGLGFCFALAWLADFIGLAPIVGAFAAGLILEDVHFKDFKEKEPQTLEELVHPISYFLVPVFFVLMGMRTDLQSFVAPGVISLAGMLILVGVVGKVVAGVGARGKGLDRLSIGVGMVPRGEVGLIFASIGTQLMVKGERVVDSKTFSAVVVMVIVTTMITPPVLKWTLNRKVSAS